MATRTPTAARTLAAASKSPLVSLQCSTSSPSPGSKETKLSLPDKLIPKFVKCFSYDDAFGLLEVRLYGPCYAHYEPTSTTRCGGTSATTLCRVVGWAQEELFLKFLVIGIMITDPTFGVILFDIGIVRKRLVTSAFDPPLEYLLEVEEVTIGIGFIFNFQR
ncbi:uncharacterized protein LOC122051975 isoform X3 [Zingiber officinale]|uniref:uncharacterized protein LOC122051975 isoform X3 n=1 Tax=Zingiber officinale TaxID=94328 RepID=UPI001C4DBE2D|nr:uncharacterized protein LOC122051975 isoform X3 [Zingiber officinale]